MGRSCVAGAALAVALTTVVLAAPVAGATEQCPTGVCAPGRPAADVPAHRGADTDTTSVGRSLLQGAVNVRDVGGHTTDTGREVRRGLVFRADALNKLTDDDLTTLSRLGVEEVVDFRRPGEVEDGGADRLPDGLTATSRPIGNAGGLEGLRDAIATGDTAKQEEILGDGRAAAYMENTYRTFVTDRASREQFAATLRDIAAGGKEALLYHCAGGKDRTGWMTYLLLRSLSVPESTVEKDYLATNEFRGGSNDQVIEQLRKSGLMKDPELVRPIMEARLDYLHAATAQVEADYGTLDAYLKKGLGLDDATLARLQERLVA
ncbi:tyrosine-protein phosphatase [Streptomyces sp. WAC06614]|nr:tyrosine-protein phosphatase [Streptomyces sp. WAC06614]